MKRARRVLVLIVLGAIALHVVWWAIEPIISGLLPIAIGLLVLVLIVGTFYYRSRRW